LIGSEPKRQILAVLAIQWLSLKNSLRRGSERVNLVVSVLVGLLWYGLWTGGGVGLLAFLILGRQERLERTLPGILFLMTIYWQLSPLLTASMGASLDLRRLAIYPVRPRTLFAVECLLRLANGAEMVLLLGGLTLGAIIRSPARTPLVIAAVALFVTFNVLLSAGMRHLIERLLERRGVREVLLLFLVVGSVMPQLLAWSQTGRRFARQAYQTFQTLPQAVMPSGSVARACLGQTAGADFLILAAWCAAAGAFGMYQFRRSFYGERSVARAPAHTASARPTWADRFYQWPGRLLRDPLAALLEKELRYLLRSPRFRFLFLMGCSFGVVAWLPFAMGRGARSAGPLQASFLPLLSLYGLLLLGQVVFLNSFGLDRAAARYFFWMPVSPVRLLVAKNLAGLMFVTAQVLVLAGICTLLRLGLGPLQVLEALGVTAIAALYLSSAGNLTSILFPSGMSPERVSRAGAGRGIQGLVALGYPVLISPILAAYFARYYWDTVRGYFLLLSIAAAGGLALYAATLPLAARLGAQRRERLLEDLSRGEGPLVSE